MKKTLVLILLVVVSCTAFGQVYDLVWSDEFNGTSIDTAKWNLEVGGGGWGNNELQYYTNRPQNARVENGNLIIEAREEFYGGYDYTSARMTTQNKASWTYGKMEARIKLPYGQGMNPAFWMIPEQFWDPGWPASGEIDIMNTVNQAETIYGSLHYGQSNPYIHESQGGTYTSGGSFSDDFHTYSIEWEEEEIRWYVDDNLFFTANDWWSGDDPYPAPFNKDFFFILNVAVGGNWPGAPDASTGFPQQMQVDYIRVYEPIPEPMTLSLLALGGLLIRKRK